MRWRATKDGKPLEGVYLNISIKDKDGKELILKELTDKDGYTRDINLQEAFE